MSEVKSETDKAIYFTNCYICNVIDFTVEHAVADNQFIMLCIKCYRGILKKGNISLDDINELKKNLI
ncbi:MAG: hypothetical protein GTO02_13840 [Candidatus Dadabacteria bacterium]|nr:hypothetical protein [Candidatus Dadabacteria bacterium]